MATEEFQSPQNHKNVVHRDIIISPRFRSVAAMAGWDEEALLAASVEDTPERESAKRQKRTNLASKSPKTNSRRFAWRFASTPCGHSFCKKCLKSAADKCGKKCPKCRQLVGNGSSCIVNTSLWNTIQLLFPREVEARKAVAAKNSREEVKDQSTVGEDSISRSRSGRTNSMAMMTDRSNIRVSSSSRNQSGRSNFMEMNREDSVSLSSPPRIRRARPSQAEDAALALRLQREEFMVAFRAAEASTAGANLRAVA
ncbi:hypothetical protein MKW92_016615 [Papaver armeniacum]|nr:hypothetical protein MKW92_016615 [Papaver armeniacum]